MLETSRNACVFSMIRVSGQSKSRPVTAAGCGVMLSAEKSKIARRCGEKAHLQVKMRKTPQSRTYFGISDVQKWHVARSTFASQNVQNMTCLDHFGTFWCWKIVRGCGEKHICKSKCTKHVSSEALFALQPSKKRTLLWRKAYVEMKMHKTWGVLEHFCKFRCRKMARRCGETHMCKWKRTKHELCCGETHMCKWKCTKHEVFGGIEAEGCCSRDCCWYCPLSCCWCCSQIS